MGKDPLGYTTILNFYRKESDDPGTSILLMAMISGIANSVLLGIINAAAEVATQEEVNLRYFLLFMLMLTVFIYTKKFAMEKATARVENIIKKVRLRVTEKIRHSELLFMESLGRTEIFTKLSQETSLLSEAALVIVNAGQSLIMLAACFVYIAVLSKLAFVITAVSIAVGVSIYFFNSKELNNEMRQSSRKEGEFFELLNHVLDGFKEIKISRAKNDSLYAAIDEVSSQSETLKIKTNLKIVIDFIFSQVFFYAVIAAIVFIMPVVDHTSAPTIIKLTAALLFIIGPLTMVVSSISIFAKTAVTIENLYDLESMLDEAAKGHEETAQVSMKSYYPFDKISLRDVRFSYEDQSGQRLFDVGPLDLAIGSGEIIFLVGGNGSGKSTLLKLLTGLYYPKGGGLFVNDRRVEKLYYQDYRELFSVIFSDFHLFDKLYGLMEVDEEKVTQLLKLMELDNKTSYDNGRFTKLDLSTGQKKRLALIITFMEDKPIYVFDEWAADQDPEFRKYFYDVILKDLKSKGKTVIAVSHDDRYFGVADRVIKMEYGRIISVSP